jgi:hypothetical protein
MTWLAIAAGVGLAAGAAETGAPGSGADVDAVTEPMLESIQEEEARNGPFSRNLIDQLTSLGLAYQEHDRHELALAMFDRALFVKRSTTPFARSGGAQNGSSIRVAIGQATRLAQDRLVALARRNPRSACRTIFMTRPSGRSTTTSAICGGDPRTNDQRRGPQRRAAASVAGPPALTRRFCALRTARALTESGARGGLRARDPMRTAAHQLKTRCRLGLRAGAAEYTRRIARSIMRGAYEPGGLVAVLATARLQRHAAHALLVRSAAGGIDRGAARPIPCIPLTPRRDR